MWRPPRRARCLGGGLSLNAVFGRLTASGSMIASGRGEIRVVDEDGGSWGDAAVEAIKLARERAWTWWRFHQRPIRPVCKITDYGKYLYRPTKRRTSSASTRKVRSLRKSSSGLPRRSTTIRFAKNQIIRFLADGHKVKAMIFHRGREMAHQEVGRAKMNRLLQEIADHALVEIGPRMEANIMMALLAPKKGGSAKSPAAPAAGQA